MTVQDIGRLAALLEPMLPAARIPGAAVAVVAEGETIFAAGFGYRDLDAKLPMTSRTLYPIASTAKAINATLLGMLVDERQLSWDAPVQHYLPRFRLHDSSITHLVTVRDLLTMRTGLPSHDFVWLENPITRADLLERMIHLPLSAGFRERFQYNDLTATVAGHIAESVTGHQWESLVQERILDPLGMIETVFPLPAVGNVTRFYHENQRRELLPSHAYEVEPIGPAGGAIYSTVEEMAFWVAFNLNGGKAAGRQLIQPETLKELQRPAVLMGADPAAPSVNAAYGMGWFVDTYQGRARVSHTGWLHDVNSCVTLFPKDCIGIVSFVNFASSRLASFINQYAFDLIMDLKPERTLEERLAEYEKKIEDVRARNASVRRIPDTVPSHSLDAYAGIYEHPGYGTIEIQLSGQTLVFKRNHLVLPLQHWHYDAWVIAANDLFEIHKPHAFDHTNRILFETNADGQIGAFPPVPM